MRARDLSYAAWALAAVGCGERGRTAKDVGWTGDDPFDAPVVTIDGDRATVDLVRRAGVPLSPERVPFTAERFVAGVTVSSGMLEESNLAGTGLALDVDGDGDTDDRVAVGCSAGGVRIGATTLRPAADAQMSVLDYDGRIQRVGDGMWALQYTPCTETSAFVGVSPADEPIELRHTDGPVLQILAFTPAATPEAPPAFDLRVSAAGRPIDVPTHEGLDYEPMFGPTPAWTSMRWVMLPVVDEARQTFEIALPAASGPTRIVAMVNLAADGKRWRMAPGVAGRD